MFRVVSRYALRTKTVYVSAALAQLLCFFTELAILTKLHWFCIYLKCTCVSMEASAHRRKKTGCIFKQKEYLPYSKLIFVVLLSGKPVKPIVASHVEIALKIFCHTWHTVLYPHLVTLYLILVQFRIDRFAKSTLQTTRHWQPGQTSTYVKCTTHVYCRSPLISLTLYKRHFESNWTTRS